MNALRTGYSQTSDSTSVQWAVFSLAQIQARFPEICSDVEAAFDGDRSAKSAVLDVAESVTGGWCEYDGGPGQSFAGVPRLRIYGRKVLVSQRVGTDI